MDKQERQKALHKFVTDPEWHVVTDLLSQNIEEIKNISTIDLSENAETIKAIIAGRQETLKLVENFIHQTDQAKSIITNDGTHPSFK